MAATVKKQDFIEIDYTGRIADTGEVFDTTVAAVAEEAGLGKDNRYVPVIVQLGAHHLLPGLEAKLEGQAVGGDVIVELSPEGGFGRRDAKRIQLVSTAKFRQQNIAPVPGLHVNIDGMNGVVRTVTGGRTIVDFNHPLAGRPLQYTVAIRRLITDAGEQVAAMLDVLGVKAEVAIAEGKATVTLASQLPAELQKQLGDEITVAVPAVKSVVFAEKKGDAPAK